MEHAHPASIAIFQKSLEDTEIVSCPLTPNEVFEAVKRVIQNKKSELIKTRTGFYVISYSETGPFKSKINDEWLPVYIFRAYKWTSGGIKKEEFENYLKDKYPDKEMNIEEWTKDNMSKLEEFP